MRVFGPILLFYLLCGVIRNIICVFVPEFRGTSRRKVEVRSMPLRNDQERIFHVGRT